MIRALVAATLFLSAGTLVAQADQKAGHLLGDVASGISVYQLPDGGIDFSASSPLYLSNGKKLELQSGGKWVVSEPSAEPAQTVKALDLALYPSRYEGRPVQIVGGRFYGVSLDWGIFDLGPTTLRAEFDGMDREQLRYLITHCSGLGEQPGCRLTVTGTVVSDGGQLALQHISLDQKRAVLHTSTGTP